MVKWDRAIIALIFIVLYFLVNVLVLYRLNIKLYGIEECAFWSSHMVFFFHSSRLESLVLFNKTNAPITGRLF